MCSKSNVSIVEKFSLQHMTKNIKKYTLFLICEKYVPTQKTQSFNKSLTSDLFWSYPQAMNYFQFIELAKRMFMILLQKIKLGSLETTSLVDSHSQPETFRLQ